MAVRKWSVSVEEERGLILTHDPDVFDLLAAGQPNVRVTPI